MLLFLLWSTLPFLLQAADKSGVSPSAISLPNGPGSIEGLGESFQPTLNTGTAKYKVPLKVPSGTAGHAPSLALSYEGGGANGACGVGWALPAAFVQRRSDNGIPQYGEDRGVQRDAVFINEMSEELVPLTNGFYFCKNEGGFIRYQQVGDHWEGRRPDGVRMEFGLTPAGRVSDQVTGQVFKWSVERITDARGNVIVYEYESFPGPENLRQKYLKTIRYGPGSPPWANYHFIVFNYEDRPDWFEDGRAGFMVRTGKRLQSMVVGTQGPDLAGHLAGDFDGDGIGDHLNHLYEIGYVRYAGTNTHWSLLGSIRQVGADGVTGLPPATFGYQICDPPGSLSAAGQEIGSTNEPPVVMDNELAELVDLNGDALPDLLRTSPTGGPHIAYLNEGPVDGQRVTRWSAPMEVLGDGLAWNVNLASTAQIGHLADMDGDGLADLVYKSSLGDVFYFANQADVSWGPRLWMSITNFAPPSPFGDPNVRTADIDFDKRMDIIKSVDNGLGADYQVWFNQGDQSYSLPRTIPQTSGFMFSWSGVEIGDFNGDRVPDIIWIRPFGVIVTAGVGYGRFEEPVAVLLDEFDDNLVGGAALRDINGDGLVDMVVDRPVPGELWYWINLGNYTFAGRKTVTGMPGGIGLNAAIRWADLNGNGTTDLLYADGFSLPRIRAVDLGNLMGCNPSPNVLVAISNGIGRVTLIGYESSTRYALEDSVQGQPWPDPLPFPVQVVASVTTQDSLGHNYLTRFAYHDGYYDAEEKQFRGFASVEQIEVGDETAPTLVARHRFDTGREFEAMKGKQLFLSAEQEDGAVFWEEVHTWTIPPRSLGTGTNGQEIHYAHPVGKTRTVKERGEGTERRLEFEMEFDAYGNQTRLAEYGIVEEDNRSAFDDERITITDYAVNLDAWLVRHPSRSRTQDEEGAVISRTEYYYDDETFSGLNSGSVVIGNLTLRRDWQDPREPMGYVESARTKFDSYGNPILIIDPLGMAPGGTVDLARGHVREVVYDPRFHTYPKTEIIHVGSNGEPLVFQARFDEGFGTVTSATEFNGHETRYRYDELGRLVNVVKPGDTDLFPTLEYSYALAVPVAGDGMINFIETRQLDAPPETAGPNHRDHYWISRDFLDGLGRKWLTKHEAEGAPGEPGSRIIVKGAALFNARQNEAAVLNPYYSQIASPLLDDLLAFESLEEPGWAGLFHENGQMQVLDLPAAHRFQTEYDATLRPVQKINPDATIQRTDYEPLQVRSYDENDSNPGSPFFETPTLRSYDGLGRLIQVEEVTRLDDDGTPGENLTHWTTHYRYDVNSQLLSITDAQGNVKAMQYDGLRRHIFLNDPDRGVMYFAYDQASNLAETRDARDQLITYTYDGANRVLTEDYQDGAIPSGSAPFSYGRDPDVLYHYDSGAGELDRGAGQLVQPANLKGKLAWVQDVTGQEHNSYDSRGRLGFRVKRISEPGLAPPVEFSTSFEYDSMDRLIRIVYPDLDEVTYEYNDRNTRQRVVGGPTSFIVSNTLYSPSGQLERIEYGNQVRGDYQYDSRLRVTQLALSAPAQSETLLHYDYQWDDFSNLKVIRDLRPEEAVAAGDPRRNTQIFSYDDLHRLTRVQFSFNLPESLPRDDGFIEYRYDRIGNLLSKSSSLKHVDEGYAVTDLGNLSYGGSAGRLGRVGRSQGDPPGPHALTEIMPAGTNQTAPRTLSYDANGNMTEWDGFHCLWDFKDRLVAVENDRMRAEYRYDFSDRRILKRVLSKTGNGSPVAQRTLYVDKYFEMRPEGQPIKFVWNGSQRVAKTMGSLGKSNTRNQWFRLASGWNLATLLVQASDAAGQLGIGEGNPVRGVYRWDENQKAWLVVDGDGSLPAGSVFWLMAEEPAWVKVRGEYQPIRRIPLPSGGAFLPSPGLFPMRIDLDLSAAGQGYWGFSKLLQQWDFWSALAASHPASLPVVMEPGGAFFVRASAPFEVTTPDEDSQIQYYHDDHLASVNLLVNGDGGLAAEYAFYPYGALRNRHDTESTVVHWESYYQFQHKERDAESGLQLFDARYLSNPLGRFCSVDSAAVLMPREMLEDPQKLHPYAYGRNNPLAYRDTSGQFSFSSGIDRKLAEIRAGKHASANPYYVDYNGGPGSQQDRMEKIPPAVAKSAKFAATVAPIIAEIAVAGLTAGSSLTVSGLAGKAAARVPGLGKVGQEALAAGIEKFTTEFSKQVVAELAQDDDMDWDLIMLESGVGSAEAAMNKLAGHLVDRAIGAAFMDEMKMDLNSLKSDANSTLKKFTLWAGDKGLDWSQGKMKDILGSMAKEAFKDSNQAE